MEKDVLFRYHPDCFENGTVKVGGTCECCGKTNVQYVDQIYSEREITCICVDCVHSGRAAAEFRGAFISGSEPLNDSSKKDELYHRTPGYESIQGEYWLVHCDDYCAFLRNTTVNELAEMGIIQEVIDDYNRISGGSLTADILVNGDFGIYLFQCLHCSKYRIWVDCF